LTHPPVPAALLSALREQSPPLPAERIDRIWLFPPRQVGAAESSLAVLSLFAEADPAGRREILTLQCTALTERGRTRRTDQWVEQGSAPADRVERVIRGVLHRLRTDSEIPRSEEIRGDPRRWKALLADGTLSA
jgi:hypothetical protein